MAQFRGNFRTHFKGVGAKARAAFIATALLVPVTLASISSDVHAATAVPLGTADSFAVFGHHGITNTGVTTIIGDIGSSPKGTITGSSTMIIVGTNHGSDSVSHSAGIDLVAAYNAAAGQPSTNAIVADLGGQTLTAGVHTSSTSIGITGVLTLDGGGNPNSVFIFQSGKTLTTASASKIVLTNGARACNVFWQVGSSATLGTGSSFVGTLMVLHDATLGTGATVNGRVLARNAVVAMNTNRVSRPSCAAVAATTTTTVAGTTATTVAGTTASTVLGNTTSPNSPQVVSPTGAVLSGQGTAVGSRARISELEQVSKFALVGKPMVKSIPLSLQIPAIGVKTNLVGLGLTEDGALEVTKSGFPASWYTGAPTPGQVGPAIIAGHSTWADAPAVFYRLGSLRQNDLITVARQDGSVATFRVTKVELYAKSNFPTKTVYGNIDFAGLRLITCGGYSIHTDRNEKNIVVYAELFGSSSRSQRYF